jgi:hydroxypyruvate reductase/glycerate 2-kinase
MTNRDKLMTIFSKTLAATLPANLVREKLSCENGILKIEGKSFSIPEDRGIHLFGSGKAAVETARAVKEILGATLKECYVVSNYPATIEGVEVFESSHPVLTHKSVAAAETLIEKIAGLSGDDFFIYVLSGGSSALIEKPIPPVTLADMQTLTKGLLANGVPIDAMNIVRKHLSLVKGGRLGRLSKAPGVVLVVSDVIGDDLEAIGSAPLFFDRSTFADAQGVMKKYGIWDIAPDTVKKIIEEGVSGLLEDTPKTVNAKIEHFVIDSNGKVLQKAKHYAEALGIKGHIMTSRLRGEAREAAQVIMAIGEEIAATGEPFEPPVMLLFGGETTVTLHGDGNGGRNQEMALAVLKEIRENRRFVFLSAGTDGIDGNSNAAGAVVDWQSWGKARDIGLKIDDYLSRNDSYNFFAQTQDLIKTGPTGTNVMDITALMII